MEKELIHESNSFKLDIVSVSIRKEDTDTILITMKDEIGNRVELLIDNIGANGFRFAMASLMDVQPLVLPLDKEGDYQCHFKRYRFVNYRGYLIFDKENGITKPLGKYKEIDDGMITFRRDNKLWLSVKLIDYSYCAISDDYDYITLRFKKKFFDEIFRVKLDKIYPFNRFGKDNKLAYGYFHSSKGEWQLWRKQ